MPMLLRKQSDYNKRILSDEPFTEIKYAERIS